MRKLWVPVAADIFALIWLPAVFSTATLSKYTYKAEIVFESLVVAIRLTGDVTVAPLAGAHIIAEGSAVSAHVPLTVMFTDEENVPAESAPTTFNTCAPDAA